MNTNDNTNQNGAGDTRKAAPSITSLHQLLNQMPATNRDVADQVVGEIREILKRVAAAGGVIYISDIARQVKSIELHPATDATRDFIFLAADLERKETGTDLLAIVLHRTPGAVSRYYLGQTDKMSETEFRQARRLWAAEVEKVHACYAAQARDAA